MLSKLKNWLKNKKIIQLEKCLAHEKSMKMRLSREVDHINFLKCQNAYLVQCFQEKVEKYTATRNFEDLSNLTDLLFYSYRFIGNHEYGRLAHSSHKQLPAASVNVARFIWRDIIADIEDGNIEFYPEQMEQIEWREYPNDSHLFIEWISHHQKILYGNESLKPYSVELY